MTFVILVRHAHSSANAEQVLSGRREGVHLSDLGRKQAAKLSKRLGLTNIKALRSSPLVRCEETIAPWIKFRAESAERDETLKIPKLRIDEGLSEVDYGLWSGEKLRKLSKDPLWKTIQEAPSRVIFPEGESLRAVQERAMIAVESALTVRGKGSILLISHGDVLKSIVAGSLNLDLDEFQRIVIDPASISILDFSGARARVILLNDSRSSVEIDSESRRSKGPLVGGGSGLLRRLK